MTSNTSPKPSASTGTRQSTSLQQPAKHAAPAFTEGSTLRHILVMTAAGTAGLLTLFLVDLVDIFFLSLLGQEELAAAIGYAGTLLFFMTATGIGLQIAVSVAISRSEGSSSNAANSARSRLMVERYFSNGLIYTAICASLIALPFIMFSEHMLIALGAKGNTLVQAQNYVSIILPSTPLLAVAMSATAVLRALGNPKAAMYAIMSAGLVNAVLDPLFIFNFGLEVEGAAIASVISRVVMLILPLRSLYQQHQLKFRIDRQHLAEDARTLNHVAVPAMLTNLATPISSTIVMKFMAAFGDSAVAGVAIVGRLAPVAFAALFALSGSVGAIVGQNAGAKRYDRVKDTLHNALAASTVYVLFAWVVLFLSTEFIVNAFEASGQSAALIRLYTHYLVIGFAFNGMLFIANASFNNLQVPHYATLFNFARSFLGTMPLVFIFSRLYGPEGVMIGETLGAVLFGLLAYGVAIRVINRVANACSAAD